MEILPINKRKLAHVLALIGITSLPLMTWKRKIEKETALTKHSWKKFVKLPRTETRAWLSFMAYILPKIEGFD